MVRAGGQPEPRDGVAKKGASFAIDRGALFDLAPREPRIRRALSFQLDSTRPLGALAHRARRLAARAVREIVGVERGALDVQVDAVEEGARHAALIAQGHGVAAPAPAALVPGAAA